MTHDDRTTRALASMAALLTPAQYAELHLRVLMELRAERERCAQECLKRAFANGVDSWAARESRKCAAAIRALD